MQNRRATGLVPRTLVRCERTHRSRKTQGNTVFVQALYRARCLEPPSVCAGLAGNGQADGQIAVLRCMQLASAPAPTAIQRSGFSGPENSARDLVRGCLEYPTFSEMDARLAFRCEEAGSRQGVGLVDFKYLDAILAPSSRGTSTAHIVDYLGWNRNVSTSRVLPPCFLA